MKVRDLHARPFDDRREAPLDYRQCYRQTAEALTDDCWTIDPAWLLNHPAFYEQIRTLDDKLTVMERADASEPEYQATLTRLVQCVRDARALYEQESAQSNERAAVQ